MQKKDSLITQMYTERMAWITIIVAALVVGLSFYINLKNREINFSQRVFAGLIKGRQSVQGMIDWACFRAVGVDVGKAYSGLGNEKERQDYKKAFIDKFSLGFRKVGGRFKSFINWRIYEHQGGFITVAADYKARDNKTILFTLSEHGKRKLTAIQWED